MKFQGRFLIAALLSLIAPRAPYAAEVGGKPEKVDVIVTYAQPSGAFTPIWVAHEAGLFKKYGLNATLQLLTPQVSAQAVVSEEVDFYTDGPDLINARLRGGSVKYFGGTMQQLVFQIWAAKELRSMRDLKGKTVAASTPRAALDTATREALKKNGLVSLAVRPEAVKGQFAYVDEKESPNAKNADPKDFYDNSFVNALSKSGFLKNLGMK